MSLTGRMTTSSVQSMLVPFGAGDGSDPPTASHDVAPRRNLSPTSQRVDPGGPLDVGTTKDRGRRDGVPGESTGYGVGTRRSCGERRSPAHSTAGATMPARSAGVDSSPLTRALLRGGTIAGPLFVATFLVDGATRTDY